MLNYVQTLTTRENKSTTTGITDLDCQCWSVSSFWRTQQARHNLQPQSKPHHTALLVWLHTLLKYTQIHAPTHTHTHTLALWPLSMWAWINQSPTSYSFYISFSFPQKYTSNTLKSYNIKLTSDINRSKRLLKSHLFNLAFWHSVSTPGQLYKPRFTNLCLHLYQLVAE